MSYENAYYKSGEIRQKYIINNDEIHRIYYRRDGSIYMQIFYKDGELHNTVSSAVISYYYNGNIECEEFFINGKRHRENGPAYIKQGKCNGYICEKYYLNDILYFDREITDNWEKFCKMQIFR